jgi:hypothetical protein
MERKFLHQPAHMLPIENFINKFLAEHVLHYTLSCRRGAIFLAQRNCNLSTLANEFLPIGTERERERAPEKYTLVFALPDNSKCPRMTRISPGLKHHLWSVEIHVFIK